MRRWKYGLVLVGSCLLAWGPSLRAEDWPAWRGPRGDGTWQAPDIAPVWPSDGLPTNWRREVGPGYSGITVANGRVYTLDRTPAEGSSEERERVLCFDLSTGNPIW
jgi:hypothetical protein